MVRPKHQDPDFEKLLREAEQKKWRVRKDKKYFKIYCPCPEKHFKTVKLTPSDPGYLRNLRGLLCRATCWDAPSEEDGS